MRPIYFEIEGLFGRNSTVSIGLESNVKILYGINGSGKTTILKLLDAVLTGRLSEISNINFRTLFLHLEDGRLIKVTKNISSTKSRSKMPFSLSIYLLSSSGKKEESSSMDDIVELVEGVPLHVIEQEIPELTRVDKREWSDSITGDILTINDVIDRYSDRIPWLPSPTRIAWFRKLVKGFSVKFIQTQRLITMKSDARSYHQRRAIRYENTVIEYSERLRELIRDKLSDSMRLAQSLDSSYPKRLLQKSGRRPSDKRLTDLLNRTEYLGDKLRQVELLSSGDNVDIALDAISEENRRAIALYLSDSIEKYEALEPFADKLLLFLDIVNTKFRPNKFVEIGGKEGIKIGLSRGGQIHPSLLSSGEQHEIVLLFDLIFFSEPGTLVLIDEPEISLHIDWQKKFLSDVEAIGKTADLKFLLATHSPAIIGNRLDICQEI